jgi:Flp pilus assembly CpaF family ATPase
MRVIDRIVSAVSRRVDDSRRWWTRARPTARASTRSSATAVDGPLLSTVVFRPRLKADDLVTLGADQADARLSVALCPFAAQLPD